MNKIFTITLIAIINAPMAYAHDINAIAEHTWGTVGTQTRMRSTHKIKLINNAPTKDTYQYIITLCVESVPRCTVETSTVTVSPHSIRWLRKGLYLDHNFSVPSDYVVTAITEVLGNGAERRTNESIAEVH